MRSSLTRWAPPLALLLLLAPALLAQDHPEHPKNNKPAANQAPPLTADTLADSIAKYVQGKSKDGWYTIHDGVQGKDLRLKLDHVHRERLARVASDKYFACADFVGDDGVTYDLDFFMQGKSAPALRFTEATIHKQTGVERYRWQEEGGVWKKVPVEKATG
jgi:hypothetical protein